MKEQIENSSLSDEEARKLARANGDKLEIEHKSLLQQINVEYGINFEISRWHQFDNSANSNHAYHFEQSLAQIYLLYILGAASSAGSPINHEKIIKIFNLIFVNKDVESFKNELKLQYETISNKYDQQNVHSITTEAIEKLTGFNTLKEGIVLDFFFFILEDEYILNFAKNFYKAVNAIATSYTDYFKDISQEMFKNFDRNLAWLHSRSYTLLYTAITLTLAKTKAYDFLLYPLQQKRQKSHHDYFNLLSKMCDYYDLKIIDITFNLLKVEPEEVASVQNQISLSSTKNYTAASTTPKSKFFHNKQKYSVNFSTIPNIDKLLDLISCSLSTLDVALNMLAVKDLERNYITLQEKASEIRQRAEDAERTVLSLPESVYKEYVTPEITAQISYLKSFELKLHPDNKQTDKEKKPTI